MKKAEYKKSKISEIKKSEHQNVLNIIKLKQQLADLAELELKNQAAVKKASDLKDKYKQNKKKHISDKKDFEAIHTQKIEDLQSKLDHSMTVQRTQESQISILIQNADYKTKVEERLRKQIAESSESVKESQSKIERSLNLKIEELEKQNDEFQNQI